MTTAIYKNDENVNCLRDELDTYLKENKEGVEVGSYFEHEAGVLSEPFDVAFISCVDEDWSLVLWTAPEGGVDQISLLKRMIALRIEVEVVKNLRVILCLVGSIRILRKPLQS